ncbi:MAG: ATP synthase F1 subunit gamma [Myxococcales bacterium]|nr:ATP synthase F1 subunit gamma [Myxococcales bacterium]MCB9534733.1 ATP synthase F1 subunit gamma [Myxococcales bacterium]
MPSLKDIRKRISSVKNTQKITKAMKLVSAAKLRRAQDAMLQLRPYAAKHREMLESLAAQLGGDEAPHPLLQAHDEVKRVGVLALSSDRGMCGAFNSQIIKRTQQYVKSRGDVAVAVYPLGRRMVTAMEKGVAEVPEAFGEIIPATSTETIRHITDTLVDGFLKGELDEVVIVSNRFRSAISQEAAVLPLLPVTPEGEADEVGGEMIYEPDQTALLQYVVPRYIEVQIRQAILESIAGEHAARMNAMNNATDNASEMIGSLTLQMNRARQAAITTELMEIIGGAEALK